MSSITIHALVKAPLSKVWEYWTNSEHVMRWNAASDDWHTPSATSDLREGGEFHYLMAAKDGSAQFDFGGVYTTVISEKEISYKMTDDRVVRVVFVEQPDGLLVTEIFDLETQNSEEMQRAGWQAILDRFKAYMEQN